MLRKISLAIVGIVVGLILTGIGFWAYFTGRPTLNLAGFFYGIPVLLGGLALKSAELEPVIVDPEPTPEIIKLRESAATATQKQVRKDVSRFRYGDEAHLAAALESLGLSPNDEVRPVLTTLREEDHGGRYVLTLTFDSPKIEFETWTEKQERIGRFFGPDVEAQVKKLEDNVVEVALVSTATAAEG